MVCMTLMRMLILEEKAAHQRGTLDGKQQCYKSRECKIKLKQMSGMIFYYR